MLGAIGSALGSSGAALGGSLLSSAANIWASENARKAGEDMYRRRYQIMVADLKKAGLNPMLAYMKDAGSPTYAHAGTVGDLGDVLTKSNSAQSYKTQVTSQAELTSASAAKVRAETELIDTQKKLMESQIYEHTAGGYLKDTEAGRIKSLLQSAIGKANSEEEAARLILPALRANAKIDESDYGQILRPLLKDLESLTHSASNLGNALNITRIIQLIQDMARRGPHSRPPTSSRGRSGGSTGGYSSGRYGTGRDARSGDTSWQLEIPRGY